MAEGIELFGIISQFNFNKDFSLKPSCFLLSKIKGYNNIKIGLEKSTVPQEDHLYWDELINAMNEGTIHCSLDNLDFKKLEKELRTHFSKLKSLHIPPADKGVLYEIGNQYAERITIASRLSSIVNNLLTEKPDVLILTIGNADYLYRQREQLEKLDIFIKDFMGFETFPPMKIVNNLCHEHQFDNEAIYQALPRNGFIREIRRLESDSLIDELLDKDIWESAQDITKLNRDYEGYLRIFEAFCRNEQLAIAFMEGYKKFGGKISLDEIKKATAEALKQYQG